MTNIIVLDVSESLGTATRKCRHWKPALTSLLVLSAILLVSGCRQNADVPVVSESWRFMDQQGDTHESVASMPHHCVLDLRTRLVWEVKRTEAGPHRNDATYSWYSEDRAQHMSEPGLPDGGDCDLERCDTEAIVATVNEAGLCGYRDWRLPQREELLTLGDYRLIESGNVLDAEFFPNALPAEYWSASTFRLYPQSAWAVSAATGLDRGERKTEDLLVRLVRGDVFNPRKPPEPGIQQKDQRP